MQRSGLVAAGDAASLRRAVANMIDNALVHGRGRVTLSAGLSDDGRSVTIAVHDEGTLHPSLAGDRAFSRFGRGPDTAGRPGAGLGLSIVEAVAAAHGGTADLTTPPDGGVRATLNLPYPGP